MNLSSTSKILVTGCSGFVGSHLLKAFANSSFTVYGSSRRDISNLSTALGVIVQYDDFLLNQPSFDGIDVLIHCATPNDVLSQGPDSGFDLAIQGFQRVLDAAVKSDIKQIYFLSTIQVYGPNLTGAITEISPINCTNKYALNHYFSEQLAQFYSYQYGLNITSLRLSNVFGVPASDSVDRNTLVPFCFINEACQAGSIVLRSSGNQTRNYVSLDAIYTAICDAFFLPFDGYRVLNIGSSWCTSIKDIALMCQEAFHSSFNKDVDIRFMSELPSEGEVFKFSSNLPIPWQDQASTRKSMYETICNLIMIKLNTLT